MEITDGMEMGVEGIEAVCMDMDCRLNAVHNAISMGMYVRADTEDLVAHSDCDIVVGRIGDQRGEKDLDLRDGLSLSDNAKSNDRSRRENDLEIGMGRDTGSSGGAGNPHHSGRVGITTFDPDRSAQRADFGGLDEGAGTPNLATERGETMDIHGA